jgi:hypothetical protein
MVTNPRLGRIYVASAGFPYGTRVEFIGGPENDIFTNGVSWTWLSADEVHQCDDQSPIPYSSLMESEKAVALSGSEPEHCMF